MDREDVARLISKYDLLAVPVVDHGRVIGIVTVDDVIDAILRESTEDVQKFGGMAAINEPYMEIGFWQMMKKRGGWLCALFLSELLTASAMQGYEGELEKAIVLTLFIPLIMSSGGNSGSQATSLLIRALALRELEIKDWWRVALREIPNGLALGAMLGLVGIVRISLWQYFGFYDYGEHWMLTADCRRRSGRHRHVRLAHRIHAAIHPATDRIRSGQRFGTVRRDPGRRHGISDLFHRRFPDPSGNAALDRPAASSSEGQGPLAQQLRSDRLADAARQPLPLRGVVSQCQKTAQALHSSP